MKTTTALQASVKQEFFDYLSSGVEEAVKLNRENLEKQLEEEINIEKAKVIIGKHTNSDLPVSPEFFFAFSLIDEIPPNADFRFVPEFELDGILIRTSNRSNNAIGVKKIAYREKIADLLQQQLYPDIKLESEKSSIYAKRIVNNIKQFEEDFQKEIHSFHYSFYKRIKHFICQKPPLILDDAVACFCNSEKKYHHRIFNFRTYEVQSEFCKEFVRHWEEKKCNEKDENEEVLTIVLNKIFPKLSEEQVKEIIAIALIEEKGIEYDSIRKIIPHEIPEEICEFLTRCEIQSKYELEELRKFQEEKAEKSAIRKAVRKTRQTFTRQLKGVISLEKIVDAIWEILKDGKEINGDTIRNYSNIQSQEICDFLEREFKLRNIKVEAEVNIAVKKRGLLNINKIHDELEIQKSFIIKGVETHNFFNLVLLINRIRKNLIFKNITSFLYSECLSILDLEKFKTQNIEQPRLANILPSYVKFLKESQYWHIIERDFDEKLFYQQLSDRWLKSLYPHIKRITGSRKEEKKKNKIAEIKYFLEQYNPKFYPSKMTTVYIEGKQKKIIRHIIVKLNSDNVTVVPVGYEDLIKVKKGKKFFTMEYFPEEKKYEISYEELDVTKLDLILSRLKELNKEVDEEAKAFDKYSEEWKDLLRTNKELCEFCERQDILTSENSHALCEVMTGGNLSNIGSINVLNVLYFLFEGEVAQDFFNDADYILFHQNIIIVKKHGELIGLPPTKRYEKFTLKKLNSEIKLVEDIGGIQRERFRAILNGIFERKTKLHFYNQSGNIFIDSLSRTTGITFVNGNEQLSWGTVSDAVKEGLTNFLNDFSFIFPKKISHIYLSIVPPKNRKPIPEDEKELLFFIESIRETEDISLSTEFRFTQEDLILLGRTGRYSGVLMSRAFGVIFNKEILNDCAEFKKAVGQQTIAIAEKHFALRGISVSETKLLRKIFIQEGIKFIQSREQLAEPIINFMNKLFEQSKQIGSSNLIIHS